MAIGTIRLPWARDGRRRRAALVLVVAPALIVALAACGDDEEGVAGASRSATLTGTAWTLASASIAGKDVAAVGTATLEFGSDGKTLAGSTGCNRFAGTYTLSGSDLTITLGPTTLAACTDAASTAQEAAVLAQLAKVASYAAGDQLVLKDASDATLLTYDAGLSGLEGTSWIATGVNNGKGAVESTTLTETVTAAFAADGKLSGFAGCNDYNGAYELSGADGIAITGVAMTRKACAEDVMALEGQYTAALDKVTTYAISGETLTLRDSSGAAQVTYTLAG